MIHINPKRKRRAVDAAPCSPLRKQKGWLAAERSQAPDVKYRGTAALSPSHPSQTAVFQRVASVNVRLHIRRLACHVLLLATLSLTLGPVPQNALAQHDPLKPSPQAVLLDGRSFAGKLIAADGNWNLTFETNDQHKNIPAADLLRWGRPAALKRAPLVVLANGGLLRADVISYDGTTATIGSAIFGDVTLPRELLAGLVFELPVDTADADQLLDWTAATNNLVLRKTRKDGVDATAGSSSSGQSTGRLRLLNGDELTGHILGVDGQNVRIQTEVGAITTDLRRVEAVRFTPPLKTVTADGIQAWLGLTDGSLLLVRRLELDTNKLTLVLAGSPTPKTPWQTSPDELVFLQPIGPKATYLSDLDAAEYRHVPFLQLPWPYGIDRNATGGRLRCGDRLFIKGLGVHSSARLTYLLDKPYSKFQAFAAIDDSTAGHGSVRFRVYVDGQKKYSGPIVRGQDAPTPISLDITAAHRLDLIVDFGDRADQQDHANWLEARLLP